MWALWLACTSSPAEPAGDQTIEIDPLRLLTRASLDARGVRPSAAEIDAIADDPSLLETYIERFLVDERFPDRVIDLYGELYLTQTESFRVPRTAFTFEEEVSAYQYASAIGDEPLRILAEIAENDLPYTDLVTADWTMHNEVLGQMYPSDYPPDATGWRRSRYTDARPSAGVLSTNGMWWRYGSTSSNLNRKRANQISRLFLCNDYLTRPIEFDRDVNLLDEAAVADAIQTDPGCVACHVSLDPLASHLYGFWYLDDTNAGDATTYHPERERLYLSFGTPPPAFYGQRTSTLGALGHSIAADPRFVECAVEQAFSRLMGREATLADGDALAVHREAFITGGLTLRSLFRSIMAHPRYRAVDSNLEGYASKKWVTASLLATQVEGLTGFVWTQGGVDMMSTDGVGVGNLAGHADGYRVVRDSRSPNATMVLVSARLAEAAAAHVMATEADLEPSERALFTEVDFSERPSTDRGAMAVQIQHLHKAVLGRIIPADGPEVNANLDLWTELESATRDPNVAWAGVLIALLRDPDFLMY